MKDFNDFLSCLDKVELSNRVIKRADDDLDLVGYMFQRKDDDNAFIIDACKHYTNELLREYHKWISQ